MLATKETTNDSNIDMTSPPYCACIGVATFNIIYVYLQNVNRKKAAALLFYRVAAL